jgi:hypothetical protein
MAGALFLTGCLNLKPAPDNTRNFLLTATDQASGSTNAAGLSVGLGPVRLPAHTSSSWIAIRNGPNELKYSETARWAEPLDRNVQRVLGANLRNHSGISSVFLGTWPATAVQRELNIQIDTLDLDATGAIVLGAQWTVRQLPGSAATATHSAHITRQGPRPADDMPGAVAALSEALAALSDQIAHSLLAPPASP